MLAKEHFVRWVPFLAPPMTLARVFLASPAPLSARLAHSDNKD